MRAVSSRVPPASRNRRSISDAVAAGRFKNNPNYLPRFYTPANFAAVASIRDACDDAGISMVQAAYSWVLKHSALDLANGDGVLLGASTLDQLDANIDACRDDGGDDLPGPVLAALARPRDAARGAPACRLVSDGLAAPSAGGGRAVWRRVVRGVNPFALCFKRSRGCGWFPPPSIAL